MTCAMELSNDNQKLIVIEKENQVGGLSKTIELNEGKEIFRTDIGPHRFLSKEKQIYKIIEDLLKEDWIQVNRQTRQLIKGKYYDYPINPRQAFRNIGFINSSIMIFSYIKSVIKFRIFNKKINNFEDYIIAKFGKKLGNFNMLNYTEKVWGIECKNIHVDWAEQRIKGLNLISAIKPNIINNKTKNKPKTLVRKFYYPKYGAGTIYTAMEKRIKEKNNQILKKSYPTKIVCKNKKIIQIELNVNGKHKIINKPRQVVSSIPMTSLLNIITPKPP